MEVFKLSRFLSLFCNQSVVRRGLLLFITLWLLALIKLAVTDSNEVSSIRRGDFPAFWSMAVIAKSSEPKRLYDLELQRKIQNQAWPSLNNTLLPAAYPAHVAFVLKPLATLDHRVARWIWTAASISAALLGVTLLVRSNPHISWAPWMIFTLLCIFSPMSRGILGGQVLPFMVLLLAMVTRLTHRRTIWSDIVMGVALGVWLIKPYYGLCALVVPLIQRRWITLVAFMLVAALSWQLAAAVAGEGWFTQWTVFTRSFAAINLETNAHQMPNLWAQLYRISGGSKGYGVQWWLTVVSAYGALALGVVMLLGRGTVGVLINQANRYGDLLIYLILSLIVVAMPQVNFYDLGIIACAVVALFRPQGSADRLFVAACVLASQVSSDPPLGLPVHFLLGICGLVYVCVRIRAKVRGLQTQCPIVSTH